MGCSRVHILRRRRLRGRRRDGGDAVRQDGVRGIGRSTIDNGSPIVPWAPQDSRTAPNARASRA
eukprot:6532886-Pyramimonas_sp.AAC.1